MTNQEKIQYYRQKTIEELEKILKSNDSTESDMVIASVELGKKQYQNGMYYTTEEVLEHLFGKANMVKNS